MVQTIGDKVADGEMRVEFHVGAHESETARDRRCKAGRSSQRAQQLRSALALAIGRRWVERIGPTSEGFIGMGELRRLGSVNCA